ncbi:hypothetical protein [Chishuiella changwenlii]|nr:hypothetical protein [Chishuiella changwenlii]
MKKFIQYLMLSISLFMTVYQSAHILEHANDKEHQETKNKYSTHDHDCTICHYSQQFVETNSEIELFEWTKILLQKDKTLYTTHLKQSVLFAHKSLRAPPYAI